MAEIGVVTKLEGSMVRVEMPRQDACQHCKACLTFSSKDTMVLLAQNDCGAVPGTMWKLPWRNPDFCLRPCFSTECLLQSFCLAC